MFLWIGSPLKALVAQVFGVAFCSIYYHNYIGVYGPEKVFETYMKMAYWIAILAIPMWLFDINVVNGLRLNGIMSEPAHYVAIMLPALFVYFQRKEYKIFGIMFVTILLSQSSIGYFGLLLIFTLPFFRLRYFISYGKYLVMIFVAIGVFFSVKWNQKFNETEGNQVVRRVKQTTESFSAIATGKFQPNVNLSTYAILSNAYITGQSVIHKPLGVGFGGYQFQYDTYYDQMTLPLNIAPSLQAKINREDANSLLLRVLVDLGVFSLIILWVMFYRGVQVYRSPQNIVPQGIFIYLLVKLIREGHYFPPEFYFFLLLFFNRSFDEKFNSSSETLMKR